MFLLRLGKTDDLFFERKYCYEFVTDSLRSIHTQTLLQTKKKEMTKRDKRTKINKTLP